MPIPGRGWAADEVRHLLYKVRAESGGPGDVVGIVTGQQSNVPGGRKKEFLRPPASEPWGRASRYGYAP